MIRLKNGSVILKTLIILSVILSFSLASILVVRKARGSKDAIIYTPLATAETKEASESADIQIAPAVTEEDTNTDAKTSDLKEPEKETTSEAPPPPKPKPASAVGQVFFGRGTPNNKFGMYVNNTAKDIKAAAELVNTNGGKWGYVLLTMNIADRDKGRWQEFMDAAKSAKVIPIVQLYNNNKCNVDKMNFGELAKVLNDVKWPTSNRYISVFNEVNAKDYWCETIDPAAYARALDKAIKAFKEKSSKFYIMPAAFNSSARTQDRYMSEDTYLIKMNEAVPGIFKKIDGWATHSYPHPNFSGDPNNLPSHYGARDTIYNYRWEMDLLKRHFGVGPLPIFITETGWLHKEGQTSCVQYSQKGLLSASTTAARYRDAFVNYWLPDERIVAITPFIFRSSDPCAEGFAWQKKDGGWYPQADMLISIPKTAGTPD